MVEFLDMSLPLLLVLAGAGLMIAEALAPGAHFIVLGVALLLAGLLGILLEPLAAPIVLAVLVLAFGGAALYAYRELDIYGGKGTARTADSDSLSGTTGRVTERVTTTDGQVKLDNGGFNPFYAARTVSGEIPEGEEVVVVDPGGGNVVTVEALGVLENDSIDQVLARGRESTDDDREDDRVEELDTEES
jgi:membrane protein implicated in regulation of membrane protease activity